MVKNELGPDALILSTRTIKNGKLGLLGKPILEITAAIDSGKPVKNVDSRSAANRSPAFTVKPSSGFNHVVDESLDDLLPKHTTPLNPASSNAISNPLKKDVNELKDLIKGLTREISELSSNENSDGCTLSPVKKVETSSSTDHLNGAGVHVDHILSMLIDKGINTKTSETIIDACHESLTEKKLTSPDLLSTKIKETIQNLIDVSPPRFSSTNDQHRIALVGPTGVGKTTTLAKIAASYLTNHSNSIALITVDTYRIAAVEQLKVYGEIMHLPVDVVITPEQMRLAIDNHQDKDLILIDTAGRSPKDGFCIEELSSFFSPELNIDKHLVLSATTRENELLNTIERFTALGLTNTIFTKIDECINLGIMLNIQTHNDNPLSYITNGQRVPEDLIEISQKTVAELIMS